MKCGGAKSCQNGGIDAGAGGHSEYDLWCGSRKALNQALFGSDDPGADRPRLEVEA